MNFSYHLEASHQLHKGEQKYKDLLSTCQIIPNCYTQKINGRVVELTGEELERAVEEFGNTVDKQNEILQNLRNMRDNLKEVTEELAEASDEKEIEKKKVIEDLKTT